MLVNMERIEVEKIKIEGTVSSYVNNRYVPTTAVEEKTYIENSKLESFKEWLKNISNSKIEKGEKVFFDKLVTFPRRKFSSSFPDNKLVLSADKADVYVIDTGRITSNLYAWPYHIAHVKDDIWEYSNGHH